MKFFKKHKVLSIILLIVVAVVAIVLLSGGKAAPVPETQVVGRHTVRQVIEETGVVEAAQSAELAFEQMGVISSMPVKKGDKVRAGDVLARLDDSAQYSDLLSARARLKSEEAILTGLLSNASAGAMGAQLGATLAQHEVSIAQAYQRLLNNDLEAYPAKDPDVQDVAAPVVSGTYQGTEEGTYFIETYASSSDSGVSIRVSGLEQGIYSASTQFPTPIGTRGLYLKFSEVRPNTRWVIQIPNTRSSSYITALNAYKSAETARDLALSQVQTSPEQLDAQEARVEQARLSVSASEVNLAKRTLRAPFAGVVLDTYKTRGEVASGAIVSLVSDSQHQIAINIPEADIANIDAGDEAEVRFDAYRDEVFQARVVFVAPAALGTNGATSFRTVLEFDGADGRIRPGLSAEVKIFAEEREDVIAVPSRAVVEIDGRRFARVLREGQIEEAEVKTGLRGSDGLVEILEGLNEGEEVITFMPRQLMSL